MSTIHLHQTTTLTPAQYVAVTSNKCGEGAKQRRDDEVTWSSKATSMLGVTRLIRHHPPLNQVPL